MYFISKEVGLIDKKIIFTHFAQFAKYITIITDDKGVFVCDKDYDEIVILNEHQAKNYILKNDYLREELNKLNIITTEEIEEYERKLKEKREKERQLREKEKEEYEYKQYLKLREKYETKN